MTQLRMVNCFLLIILFFDVTNFKLTGKSDAGCVIVALSKQITSEYLHIDSIENLESQIDFIICKCFAPDTSINNHEIFVEALEAYLYDKPFFRLGTSMLLVLVISIVRRPLKFNFSKIFQIHLKEHSLIIS